MADFFIRENPLLNSSPNNEKWEREPVYAPNTVPESETPVMLDYGEFGFPDEQVVREWTFLGCITAIFCTLAVCLGLGILGYTIYNMYSEQNSGSEDTGTFIVTNTAQSFRRAEVKAFSVDCQWNYPSAIAITPEGRYLITSGGPRTRSEEELSRSGNSMETESQMELAGDGNFDEIDTPMRQISYDSQPPQAPASSYMDFFNLGKNGKRLIDSYQQNQDDMADELDAETEEDNINYLELLSDTSSDSGLPDLADLHKDPNSETNVWKKTRPSVESYPMAFWSVETMHPVAVYWNHEFPIVSIAVSPDGTKVVSVDNGGNAILWSLDNLPGENGLETPTWHFVNKMTPNMRVRQRMGRVHTLHAVTFTPSGRQFLMAATVDALDETGNPYTTCGALILWDIENWKEVLRQRGSGGVSEKIDTYYQTFNPVGKFCDVAYTPNGKYLLAAAAGANAGVYYFNNRTTNPSYGICMADLQSDRQRPRTSASSEFKPNLVQGISHHDFPNAESVAITISPSDPNSNKKGLTVVSADNYGRIAFWDFAPRTNRPREGVTCSTYWSPQNTENVTRNIRDILYSPDKKFVMILGDEILLFSGRTPYDYIGSFRSTTSEHDPMERTEYFLVSGFFTQDNKYFFGGGDDCLLRAWHMDEMPIDSRFLADRPGSLNQKNDMKDQKNSSGDEEEEPTLESIQKDFESQAGPLPSLRRDRDEDEDDEDDELDSDGKWNSRQSRSRRSSDAIETDLSVPPRVTGEEAHIFHEVD
ncbi:MAG: WD40 repeat domain-containing protein [Planctomycetia bacterium]|nr:WD40 repeat domain-containing protein [Planctomycetia bacterium]